MPILRVLLAVLLLPALAGCTASSPVGDSEASHAGVSCPPGTFVSSFNAAGAPSCAPVPSALAGFSCPAGQAVVGFTAAGVPVCAALSAGGTFSSNGTSTDEAKITLALTSAGAFANGVKTYTVASAGGFSYQQIQLTRNGAAATMRTEPSCPAPVGGEWTACRAGETLGATSTVKAGDAWKVGGAPGDTLRVVDVAASTVVLTLTMS